MRKITSLAELDSALAQSSVKPVLIFKHSPTCGRSGMAAEEVAELVDSHPIGSDIHVVDVRTSREVSLAVAERFNVRHESPQVLVIRDGGVLWHRSHAGVTASAIAGALATTLGVA